MKIGFVLLILLGCFSGADAHQPDVSATMLVEKENNQWILQINASLTAYQHEIKEKYTDTGYSTPEEFKELVIKHLSENLIVLFNNQDTAVLQRATVKLGHETMAAFQVIGVPDSIKSLYVKNSSFKSIHRNQCALVLLKKGFSRKQFVLNDKNAHAVNLIVDNAAFELEVDGINCSFPLILLISILFCALTLGIWTYFKPKPISFAFN